MTDHPMLFSAPMIRALFDGRKSQTRRLLSPQPEKDGNGTYHVFNRFGGLIGVPEDRVGIEAIDYCKYQVGDRLWVRETWSGPFRMTGIPPRDWIPTGVWYWADGNPEDGDWTRPKPGIHQPRWASRLTLVITDVRVQRLRDISEEDAIAEGVGPFCHPLGRKDLVWVGTEMTCKSPSLAYSDLWDSINGKKHPWASNPWIVAISFEAHRSNIDALP